MTDFSVRIELETDRRTDGLPHLLPGDHAEGNVAIVPGTELGATNVEVRVGWHTEGRGETDGEIVVRCASTLAPLTARQLVLHPFSFRVPLAPWSFSGSLLSIVWKIEATVEVAGIRHDAELPIVVAPLVRSGIAGPW